MKLGYYHNSLPAVLQHHRLLYARMPLPQVLCKGFPQEFVLYFQYVRAQRFEEKPDYAYLRRLFRDLFAKEGKRSAARSAFYAKLLCQMHWSCVSADMKACDILTGCGVVCLLAVRRLDVGLRV